MGDLVLWVSGEWSFQAKEQPGHRAQGRRGLCVVQAWQRGLVAGAEERAGWREGERDWGPVEPDHGVGSYRPL